MKEIWKDIADYGGSYQVSNLGRVRNADGLVMKQRRGKDGYCRILLYKDGKYKGEYPHILVAKHFIEKPTGDNLEVNHIDGVKQNNSVSNLEWVTRRENHFHAVKLGLKPPNPTLGKYGSEKPCSKPIYQYSLDGVFIRAWRSRADAAEYYNTTPNSISRCMNGVRQSCKGYIWRHEKI